MDKGASEAIAAAADRVMEAMLYARPARAIGPKRFHAIDHAVEMKRFSGVVLEAGFLTDRYQQTTVLVGEVTPDVIWPIDAGMAHLMDDGSVKIVKARSTEAAKWRGKVKLVSSKMLQVDHILIDKDNIVRERETGPIAFIGGEFTVADHMMSRVIGRNCVSKRDGDVSMDRQTAWVLMGLALSNHYEWSIGLRLGDGPELRVLTDVHGIGALFRDRERGNRTRREALAHWVANHWRRHRSDADMEAYVRDHLRGAGWFRWAGYDCRIHIAPYDREREARLIAERAGMRDAGLSPRRITR